MGGIIQYRLTDTVTGIYYEFSGRFLVAENIPDEGKVLILSKDIKNQGQYYLIARSFDKTICRVMPVKTGEEMKKALQEMTTHLSKRTLKTFCSLK